MKQNQSNKYANLLSFIDLLFNICLGFAAMFLLSLILISTVKNQTESLKKDVLYFIRIEWQGDLDTDIDMWLQDPTGDMIGYRDKQRPHMYLERDNLGNDYNLKEPGHVNEEIISVLKGIPGWYTLNLHWFDRRQDQRQPEITWQIISMKPSMNTAQTGMVQMKFKGQEITAVRFKLNKEGMIEQIDTRVQNMFVLKKLGR